MTNTDGSGGDARPQAGAPAAIHPDDVLDTIGLFCPVPIIRTAERMKRMDPGGVLEVLSDDRVILIDMPAWCRSTGNDYLGARPVDGEIHLFIRRKGAESET
ncbi:MAG: sulfurtransferase TusA family protein [Acidobacteriota bacterium]